VRSHVAAVVIPVAAALAFIKTSPMHALPMCVCMYTSFILCSTRRPQGLATDDSIAARSSPWQSTAATPISALTLLLLYSDWK
jgi:hypothetical protein